MAKVMGVSVEFIKAMEQKVDPSQLPQVGAALASWDLWILAGWCSCCRFFSKETSKRGLTFDRPNFQILFELRGEFE
jgi:hypothetical protein